MLHNDNLFNIVIDKNKELRNKISELALKIQGISTIERDAKDKGQRTLERRLCKKGITGICYGNVFFS